jgi:hypothetical protein
LPLSAAEEIDKSPASQAKTGGSADKNAIRPSGFRGRAELLEGRP